MKPNRTITTLPLLLSVIGFSAMAQPPITREQVQFELREAIRTGDIIEGDSSLTRYELNPGRYPAHPTVVGKTREQVQAELRDAIRTGDIIEGDAGLTRYERNPGAYPVRPVAAGKTRGEVRAEFAEALRTGDVESGESSLKLNEQFPGRYLKVRAVNPISEAAAPIVLAGLDATRGYGATAANDSYETYRCAVLGDSTACQPKTAYAPSYRLVPGSYARYLIHNGMPEADALTAAHSAGELAAWQATAEVPQPRLSASQLHEQYLGRTVQP